MEINCPQCGADFRLEKPEVFISCEFCKNSLFIDIDKITAVYSFEPAIKSQELISYLKKDFEKIGFNEKFELIDATPVYFPFWKIGGEKKLERGSHRFPEEKIESLSARQNFFNASEIDFRIEVVGIDTQPKDSGNRTLYYYPFFTVEIEFKKKRYQFFINAVNGCVYGDPIPFFTGEDANKLFPLFSVIFLFFLVVNYFFQSLFFSVVINSLAIVFFFQLSYSIVERRFYKK